MVARGKAKNTVQKGRVGVEVMEISFFSNDNHVNKEAIGAGIYRFMINKGNVTKALYIGESFSMLARCADHIYELKKDMSYFGLKEEYWEDEELELIVDIYESISVDGLSSSDRDILLREKELNAIKKEKPLAQLETSDRLRKDRVEHVQKYLDSLNTIKIAYLKTIQPEDRKDIKPA